jgi:DNA polymerase I-like protein with 3'-5' exonuclease and polymerase domains
VKAKDAGWIQKPLWTPEITWTAPDLATIPSWRDAKRICLDVETRDDDLSALGPGVRRGGYVCGVSFAIEDGPAHYLPVRHEGGGNLDPAQVWSYLRDNALLFAGEFIFNSAPYDLDYLWQNGVDTSKAAWHRDVQVAEPLLDENQLTYGLDAIAARRGLPGKDERELREHAKAWGIDTKRGMWRLHAGAVGRYAEQDVRLPLQILRRQEREIEEQDLQKVYDLESKVTPALVRMTRRGMRIDLDELDKVEKWATQRLQDYIDQIHQLTGVRVGSISNARELYPALKKRGLSVPTPVHGGTGKETPSITKLWLSQQDDDVAKAIVSGREFVKLLTTYVAGYRKHMVGDRIYASFKQLHSASDDDEEEDEGARFGRCAAKHPNVHAQMKRSKEIQKKWRKVHCANEHENIYEADYSQQEPRTTVHYAEICRLPGAAKAAQRYRDNPMQDSYDLMLELLKWPREKRDDVKELYLGRCYGMGGGKMAKKLKLPTEWRTNARDGRTYEAAGPEAQKILDAFDQGVPYVRALAKLCEKMAKARGYLISEDGRRLRFPMDASGNYDWVYKALNRLIQGRSAGQTKTALVDLDVAGIPIDLTVHDAFRFSGGSDEQAFQMADIMRAAMPMRVPSRVDLTRGQNYGEMKKLENT